MTNVVWNLAPNELKELITTAAEDFDYVPPPTGRGMYCFVGGFFSVVLLLIL